MKMKMIVIFLTIIKMSQLPMRSWTIYEVVYDTIYYEFQESKLQLKIIT
jgi:hypothetical protein